MTSTQPFALPAPPRTWNWFDAFRAPAVLGIGNRHVSIGGRRCNGQVPYPPWVPSKEIEAIAYPHASDPLLRSDQVVAARGRLDRQTWELAWAEGRAMTTEQAIAEALGGRLGAPREATEA